MINFNQCPICKKLGYKSKLYLSGCEISTLLTSQQFYDEEGKFHIHNFNESYTNWYCSRGHQGIKIASTKCPNCNFGYKEKIEYYEKGKLISLPICASKIKKLKAPKLNS